MKDKRTAVVGAGWFGRAHIRNYNQVSKLIAVCDAYKENLDLVKGLYDNINVYTNVDDMIKSEDIDAVSVVTPPSNIPAISRKFAEKGIDVLMEKPMALKLSDLEQFKEFTNCRIMPGFIELYNPVFDKLLENLPEIGEIITITSKRIGLYPKRDWNMGVILDLSIHDIYLQERILGEVKNAIGMVNRFVDNKHEDAAFILLDFGKAKGSIESNWYTPTKFRRMYVHGANGTIEINFISQTFNFRRGLNLLGDNPATKDETYSPLKLEEPLKREILNFLYDKDKDIKVTLDDGIRTLKTALEVIEKAK